MTVRGWLRRIEFPLFGCFCALVRCPKWSWPSYILATEAEEHTRTLGSVTCTTERQAFSQESVVKLGGTNHLPSKWEHTAARASENTQRRGTCTLKLTRLLPIRCRDPPLCRRALFHFSPQRFRSFSLFTANSQLLCCAN